MIQNPECIILFDGLCNLCNNSVQFIIRYDKKRKFKFASLQSDIAQKLIPDFKQESNLPESIILIENRKMYQQSTAALRIAKRLQFPISLLFAFSIVPRFIRDGAYQWIAKNRYRWFGKRASCMVPSTELKERFL